MRLIDYLLLAIVAVCAVIAWRVWRRAMKKGGCCGSGCTGNCAQCGRNCDCKIDKSKASQIREALLFLCVWPRSQLRNMRRVSVLPDQGREIVRAQPHGGRVVVRVHADEPRLSEKRGVEVELQCCKSAYEPVAYRPALILPASSTPTENGETRCGALWESGTAARRFRPETRLGFRRAPAI